MAIPTAIVALVGSAVEQSVHRLTLTVQLMPLIGFFYAVDLLIIWGQHSLSSCLGHEGFANDETGTVSAEVHLV
jgi:hypothetical protein